MSGINSSWNTGINTSTCNCQTLSAFSFDLDKYLHRWNQHQGNRNKIQEKLIEIFERKIVMNQQIQEWQKGENIDEVENY